MENNVSDNPIETTLDAVEETNVAPGSHKSVWLDFGPLLVFFVAFHVIRRSNPDEALFIAAAIFSVAAVMALTLGWLKHKTISGLLVFSTLIIVGTTALALFFDNKLFLFMKPTVINTLMGVGVIGGVFFKKNVIRLVLGDAFTLPDRAWNTLAIRWGLLFFAMAIINELVWRTQTENFWVNFKTFGFVPLTIVFTLMQLPFIKRHGGLEGLEKSSDS
jgi:intracellular septation protein